MIGISQYAPSSRFHDLLICLDYTPVVREV